MKQKKLIYYLIILIGLTVLSCSNEPQSPSKNQQSSEQERLIRANKYLVGKDADIIKSYVKRRNWDMQITQSGLWYMIYEKGNGPAVTSGKEVTINYKVWLLDGTLCYSSDKLGAKKFSLGKGGIETGIDEGVRLMHVGDKARFILPPHLAHGLLGDDDKIPSRSIIMYEVELTHISN